jgi:thioredoxin reductase (NADPH)
VDTVHVTVRGEPEPRVLSAQVVVAALGFKMQLGAIASWGLKLRDRSIVVDPAMRTSIDGVFAAGDITTYEGKVKLISVGFGEVALAVNNAAAMLQPDRGVTPGHSSDVFPAGINAPAELSPTKR